MDVSPEHLVAQARERFQLRDYHGAIHLLARTEGIFTEPAGGTMKRVRSARSCGAPA